MYDFDHLVATHIFCGGMAKDNKQKEEGSEEMYFSHGEF
jgi:hypothetical protein